MKGFKDFCMKALARIGPCLVYVCYIRSKSDPNQRPEAIQLPAHSAQRPFRQARNPQTPNPNPRVGGVGSASERRGNSLKRAAKQSPGSGLDWRMFAIFARLRTPTRDRKVSNFLLSCQISCSSRTTTALSSLQPPNPGP